jgi:hypothetical protein
MDSTLEAWQRLYEVWNQFKQIAPWEWMNETNIFGVKDPDTGQLGFVSVMGALGEHYAIALYLGQEGLYGFLAMLQAGPNIPPELILNVPQLQASFEDRDTLHERDRKLIKQLGLKFRGQQAWPMFRSYRPGFAPWFLEANELRFFTHALEQAREVVTRYGHNWAILPTQPLHYLVRVARPHKGTLIWEDQHMPVPPPQPAQIQLRWDTQAIASLKKLPRLGSKVEMDLFMLPSAIRDAGDRPYYAHNLLLVDRQSGFILGQDLLQPLPSLFEMFGQVPMYVVRQIARLGGLPKEIWVSSPLLRQLLPTLTDELGIKLKTADRLPMLDSARQELFRFLMR